jgi:hypothetical protein
MGRLSSASRPSSNVTSDAHTERRAIANVRVIERIHVGITEVPEMAVEGCPISITATLGTEFI